jgi:anti-sigma28 factor (negative regulator of flagellin synthesis)
MGLRMKRKRCRHTLNRLSSLRRRGRLSYYSASGAPAQKKMSLFGNAGRPADVVKIITLIPDSREDTVQRLRHEIRSGNYTIYSEAVAEKILSEFSAESIHRFAPQE